MLAAALLKTTSSLAQNQPLAAAPPARPDRSSYEDVSVPVPRAVTLLSDVLGVLVSRNEGQDKVTALIARRRERAKKGGQDLHISLPKNRLTRSLGLVE